MGSAHQAITTELQLELLEGVMEVEAKRRVRWSPPTQALVGEAAAASSIFASTFAQRPRAPSSR
jgi:hypothetical protein